MFSVGDKVEVKQAGSLYFGIIENVNKNSL